jgi:hypothetical protein
MDDVSPRSVRHALTELQLKVKQLEEEADYYVNLAASSQHAFADHRNELDRLLARERDMAMRSEDQLQRELQGMLQENANMQGERAAEQAKASARVSAAMEKLQRGSLATEQMLRNDIDAAHEELLAGRQSAAAVGADHDEHRHAVGGLRQRQQELQDTIRDLAAGNDQLMHETARNAAALARTRSLSPIRRAPQKEVRPPFIPNSSATAVKRSSAKGVASSTTHNAIAMAQTVRKANYRSPPRDQRGRPVTSYNGTELDSVANSILGELLELRSEYEAITRCLADPAAASPAVTRRLRAIFHAIEDKTAQLQNVSHSQARMDTEYRMGRMVHAADHLNTECSGKLRALMSNVHSVSS